MCSLVTRHTHYFSSRVYSRYGAASGASLPHSRLLFLSQALVTQCLSDWLKQPSEVWHQRSTNVAPMTESTSWSTWFWITTHLLWMCGVTEGLGQFPSSFSVHTHTQARITFFPLYFNFHLKVWIVQNAKTEQTCLCAAGLNNTSTTRFALQSAGKQPPDHFHVQSTTGWFVSDLRPSLPLLLPLHHRQRAKTKQRPSRKKKLLLRKLHAAETGTSYLNCWLMLKVTGYRPRLSHRSAHFGPWKENKHEISCFAARVKGKQCLADAYRKDIYVYCTRRWK